MARKPRIKYTEELKAEIWRKYKQGESLWSIARSLDRSSVSIYRQLAPTGGIPPAVRTRSASSRPNRSSRSPMLGRRMPYCRQSFSNRFHDFFRVTVIEVFHHKLEKLWGWHLF